MIDYTHIGNLMLYRSIDQLPGEITAKVSHGSIQPLLRLEPSQAKETLGIFVLMDTNIKDQISPIIGKTRQMAVIFTNIKCTKKSSLIFVYSSVFEND